MWHKPCRPFHPWCPCIKTRCLLPILTPDYWHPPQSKGGNFYAPVNGQWVNKQALYFLGLSEFTHVSMHDWAAGAAKPDNWPSQLTKEWQSAIRLHWGTLCFIPGNGAHVCWIEEKYMVIHIYDITLNTAKSADQYYPSYSYQSSSLISYLMYNDLHHDCKPYEQTK